MKGAFLHRLLVMCSTVGQLACPGDGWARAPAPRGCSGRAGMDIGSSAPAESWRGSGLAEDVGANPHRSEDSLPEADRQRMMKEAARELGLPDRDERGTRR
ncbi:hypothetical protein KYC5002_35875 [Archangium violaceum]|uniref:hypothetical protein n=1 Tax=Archangium violaceum TaxID=83451 RepID=UPI002B2D77B0|nr:hypothetical protein KYC5002_35875 [Archangium gephyra]